MSSSSLTILLISGAVWELGWKFLALAKAGKSKQPFWFTALLFSFSLGALPIIYLVTHNDYLGYSDDDGRNEIMTF